MFECLHWFSIYKAPIVRLCSDFQSGKNQFVSVWYKVKMGMSNNMLVEFDILVVDD
ncbi:MAG: hypothetical protein AAGA77_10750 [Bacteroidota bacterium]